jgi:hypothetical protein
MIVTLTSLEQNSSGGLVPGRISIKFMDKNQFDYNYGFGSSLYGCYDCTVNNKMTFIATSFGGFFDNLPIESNSESGVGMVGNTWLGNVLGSRILTINFNNVFSRSENKDISPNEFLTMLMSQPTSLVEVGVKLSEEDTDYKLVCHFFGDTSLESGTIALESALPNSGAFWNGGIVTNWYNIYEESPTIPFKLPQYLLENYFYPFTKNIISSASQALYFEASGETNGSFSKVRIKLNSDVELFYNGDAILRELIIDSVEEKITNELNEDVSEFLEIVKGESKFLYLKSGINALEVIFDEEFEFSKLPNLPTDTRILYRYEKLVNSLGGVLNC